MRQLLNCIYQLFQPKQNCVNTIILGTEYPEYKLCKTLKCKGDKVHFFISEDPWKYNTTIEGTLCRPPIELSSLCEKYQIDYVYYCDSQWLAKIPLLGPQTKILSYPE